MHAHAFLPDTGSFIRHTCAIAWGTHSSTCAKRNKLNPKQNHGGPMTKTKISKTATTRPPATLKKVSELYASSKMLSCLRILSALVGTPPALRNFGGLLLALSTSGMPAQIVHLIKKLPTLDQRMWAGLTCKEVRAYFWAPSLTVVPQ
jgi:hypothetical protein